MKEKTLRLLLSLTLAVALPKIRSPVGEGT